MTLLLLLLLGALPSIHTHGNTNRRLSDNILHLPGHNNNNNNMDGTYLQRTIHGEFNFFISSNNKNNHQTRQWFKKNENKRWEAQQDKQVRCGIITHHIRIGKISSRNKVVLLLLKEVGPQAYRHKVGNDRMFSIMTNNSSNSNNHNRTKASCHKLSMFI